MRFFPKSEYTFSIVAGIRPNFHNYQIRSLLGKKGIANFNHFLKNPLCCDLTESSGGKTISFNEL
jgi:hypothetical protein